MWCKKIAPYGRRTESEIINIIVKSVFLEVFIFFYIIRIVSIVNVTFNLRTELNCTLFCKLRQVKIFVFKCCSVVAVDAGIF